MPLDYKTFAPFSGVGIVTMYPRLAGGALAGGFDLGEAPVFKITQNVPSVELNTSRDTSRGVAFRMAQSKGAQLEIQLRTLSTFNLQILTGGSWTETAAGSAVPGWTAPEGLVVGSVVRLPARNVSAVTVKDSTAGTAKTLVAGTDYELDAAAGTIKILDLDVSGAVVQPLKIDYTPGAVQTLGALKATDTEYLVQLSGTNAHNGERGILSGFKFRFAAEGDSDWISAEYGTYTLRGSLLQDETRLANSAGGQYYEFVKAAA